MAVVALNRHPRRPIWILPHRRAAPRAAIAPGVAELPDGAAGVDPPAIVQSRVRVRVQGPLGRKPRRRPELPPVEVPAQALIQGRRAIERETHPVVPALLVRLLE